MNIKEIIKHFRTQAQSKFNPSPDGSREKYYEGRKDAYNDCADILERYSVKYPNGWHPASEPPKEGEEVMVVQTGSITAYRAVFIDGIYYSVIIGKKAYYPSVEWWCYPPKED